MNQYFILTPKDKNRWSLFPSIKQTTQSNGYETFDAASRDANHIGGTVVKHYTRDDFNRDYEGGA